ncbi:MAG: GGDEF and EAL domain-containing protein, partial [Lachnospiraceae bacterium]|nr:GGDEF and EAL domain-containing protein [Lachnospiraceae bacterium]
MDFDSIMKGYDSKLFDVLSQSSSRTFFFASNLKENTTRWSKGAVEYFGLESEILRPADIEWLSRIHPDDKMAFLKDFEDMAKHVSAYHDVEYRIRNAEGDYVWVNDKGYMTYDEDGKMDFFAGFVTNMGVRNKIDPVTGLWTLHEFRKDAENLLYENKSGAAVLIGLNNFKRVNDEFGYSYGDKTLYMIAHKMLEVRTPGTRIYRMDGSDFAVLIADGNCESVIREVEKIQRAFATLDIEKNPVHLDFRAGAVLFPQDGKYIDQIMSNMLVALENAKSMSRTGITFYTEEMHLKKTRMLRLRDAVRESVNDNFRGFSIVMQPIIDSKTGKGTSCETLLRWNDEQFPGTGPMEFIPILEDTTLIIPVGKWIIDQVLKDLRTWENEGKNPIEKVHVNVSYIQLQDDDLVNYTVNKLKEYDIAPERLVLELTESCRIGRIDELTERLQKFKDQGISIALDDFGTGYASLSVLKDIPTDIVKLDHTMIKSVVGTDKERKLIEFIISFCNNVGIIVCAEGVEDTNIMGIVNEAGAGLLQGYYFDKPLRVEEFYNKYVSNSVRQD